MERETKQCVMWSTEREQQGMKPVLDSVTVTEAELSATDGIPLAARVYRADNPVELTILMLPGIGVPQRAFRHLASWLAVRGARCVTVDYRGMGQSATRKGIETATLSAWARRDAIAALEYAEDMGPEPVVLIGHSFGGQAVGLANALHRVRAAVFVGTQFGQARHWDGAARWWLTLYWHALLPLAAKLFSVLPQWTGPAGPLPSGVASEWARWGRSREWYVSWEPESARLLARFSAPILAYAITDDPIAPPRAVSAFLERFSATVPIRRDVDPHEMALAHVGHVGLLRPSEGAEVIWREMLAFLRCEAVNKDADASDSCACASHIQTIRELT